MNAILNLSRREFLKAAGGLALGFHLPQALAQSGPGRTVSTDLAGAFSRRITIQHRLVYQVMKRDRVVKVLRMWTHYE